MNERTLENIAIDLWLGKIQNGLVVTKFPKYDLHQFYRLIESYSPDVEIRLMSNEVRLGNRRVKFSSLNSIEDAYKHAGAQYNAMYLEFSSDFRALQYIQSRLRSAKNERRYIEYI